MFALMTRRQTSDYVKVFSALLDILPRRASVQTVYADFEKAAWAVARQTLPGLVVQGCHFHWSQAIWRHVQEAGLQVRYNDDRQTYETVQQLLSLPFVPTTAVRECFQHIHASIDDDDTRLPTLMEYVDRTWIQSTTFPPASWNVYRKTTRTNNDCEGWHRRLNHHARDSKPQMYVLIPILFEEAEKLPLQRQMVAEGTLKRLQRKNVRDRQKRYDSLWDRFDEGSLTPITLLQELSRVCSPPS